MTINREKKKKKLGIFIIVTFVDLIFFFRIIQ